MGNEARGARRYLMRTFVLVAFAVLGLLFAGIGALTLERIHANQLQVRALVDDTVVSTELASEMSRDVYRLRLLLDEHIFERTPQRMGEIEHEMDAVAANFRETAEKYDPLAWLPEERVAWEELRREVAALREPVAQVVAFSRLDMDRQAYAARERLNAPLAAIDSRVDALIRMNHDSGERSVAAMSALQQRSAWLIGTMGALGLGLTLLIGFAVTRLVQLRETRLFVDKADLETRNRDLDAFAGRVAHDLRGPLTTVGFAASRLERRAPGEGGTIAILQRAVGRMERLIEDLLTLSRLGFPQQESVCDPAEAAAAVREDVEARLYADDADVRVSVESAPVRCPAGLLRQALYNLADNALKYRRSDVRLQVDIEGHSVDSRYELRVRDNGIGMSPEQASRVFEPFYRAQRARDGGTGLGLSIVKRIADATGGTVQVDSRPGQGSQFVVTLPMASHAPGVH